MHIGWVSRDMTPILNTSAHRVAGICPGQVDVAELRAGAVDSPACQDKVDTPASI